MTEPRAVGTVGRSLRADCADCFGLCCVAPAFVASTDFALTKKAGQPCPNLAPDYRCGIRTSLRQQGFPGCVVYDCFGAGQAVSQITFGGQDWRDTPERAQQMFDVFPIMRILHELLWYLTEALRLPAAGPLHDELGLLRAVTEKLTDGTADTLLGLDSDAHRQRVADVLARVSGLVRADHGAISRNAEHPNADHRNADHRNADHRNADLIGANLSNQDLRGADLRGALLIGAALDGADLSGADLIGADLRGASLMGTNLRGAIFLTQSQLEAAKGDAATAFSPPLTRPEHW